MKTRYLTPEELSQEIQSLLQFKAEMKHLYASHIGNGQNKRLFITGTGDFLVEDHGKEVCRTTQATTAIETYYDL
jgi:hypothetical protein